MRIDTAAAVKQQEVKKVDFILPEGPYDFQVVSAEEKISKAGNEMIKLKLKVWAPDGSERYVYDYLLSAVIYKLKHFCDSVGLREQFDKGELLPMDCTGKSGKVLLKIDKASGAYPEKNSVKDYMSAGAAKAIDQDNSFLDSDIPF